MTTTSYFYISAETGCHLLGRPVWILHRFLHDCTTEAAAAAAAAADL